jgi:hypothetical protein
MALTMKEKRKVAKEIARRYQKASKKEKGIILDEFVCLTGYTRCYAAFILRNWGRKIRIRAKGVNTIIIVGEERKKKEAKRERLYDQEVLSALEKIWTISDFICGKRLKPFLPELLCRLERFGEIKVASEVREKLLKISPATIDRMLAQEKKKINLKGRSTTKPGTLLKSQIPIRTFSDWDEEKPGFLEVDLVSHDGGNPKGDFIQTLDVTDVLTAWTETKAVKNKAQRWVFEALEEVRERLPFPILGIDSDNGSEFINNHLRRYCEEEKITFTRTRPYRKNDNCFVEQKNYSVVRRNVGYLRYDTEEELKLLNELYSYLRLYTNFFSPTMKLVEKERVGARVKKKYDQAKTPYQRVMLSEDVSEENKERLRKEYVKLNPAHLKREITRLQNKLIKLATLKEKLRREQKEAKDFEYISDEATNNHFEYIFT